MLLCGCHRRPYSRGSVNTADGVATADYRVITPGYFAVIRTPLRVGRFFTEQDGPDASGAAIVNEAFARTYFPHEEATGKRIRLESRPDNRVAALAPPRNDVVQIVGVVQDSRQTAARQMRDLSEPVSPEIFVPFRQRPEAGRDMAILLRTETEPAILTGAVRAQVLGLDGNLPVYDVETLQQISDVTLGPARLCLLLLGIFAGAALLTACVGLFAIVSYTVTQRTQEIGIRMALGAGSREVLRVVAAEGALVVVGGLSAGLVASFGVTRLMSTLLYRVPSNDLATLAAVSALLTAVAVLASYIPARRAIKVDPIVALRYE